MTCEACQAAIDNPASGRVNTACPDCKARSLAKSPTWADARAANAMTPGYRSALRAVFGKDWREGHEKVKHWDAVLKGQG